MSNNKESIIQLHFALNAQTKEMVSNAVLVNNTQNAIIAVNSLRFDQDPNCTKVVRSVVLISVISTFPPAKKTVQS